MHLLRAHPVLHRWLLAVGCALWVVGGTAARLHGALHQHTVCAEHGVVEHAATRAAPDADGPTAGADDAEHGEACDQQALPSLPPDVPVVVARTLPPADAPAPAPFVDAASPRGPPLAYAPKTSPPRGA